MVKINHVAIVGGCGHVGLPLGIVLAAHGGYQVTLIDIDTKKVDAVNAGQMPFRETGAEEVLRQVIKQNLCATTDSASLRTADAVITAVGTHVDEHLNPTVNALFADVERTIQEMQQNSLLVLRSTVYPGVTRLIFELIRARNVHIHVAFCPERIVEGKALEELNKLPQIISAFEPKALEKARELFGRIAPQIIELTPLEAELAKLFSNSWRYLNFAISNQFFMLAQSHGADFYKIHDAVTRNYPRMSAFQRAGFTGGPCLLKDTLHLSAFSGNDFFMGHAAMLINEGLPSFVVDQLRGKDLAKLRVAILGMAFKGDSDDSRDSLSYKLKKLLQLHALEVICTDPFVPDPTLVPLEEAINRADIIILGAPHSAYRNLKFPAEKTVVEIWGFWPERGKVSASDPLDAKI
ncbi:MAG TPA: nucleotide sugar dehydrogenase [Terriglobia bacterium]|nr:nucleotide sugar dehydrogenase [Terriglobia bacterium]